VKIPAGLAAGSALFDGSHSAAACNQSVAGYLWTAGGGVTITSGASTSTVTVHWNGAAGSLTLTVTDSAGKTDTATVAFTAGGATTLAPANAGTGVAACPTPMTFAATAPIVTPAFSPASVATNTAATLTITLANANPFVLTQSALSQSLPGGLTVDSTTAPTTTCTGANLSLTNTSGGVTLSNANIPAKSSCSITVSVKSASAAGYTVSDAASALSTGPAGGSTAATSATLTVTAPAHGGGGDLDGFDILLVAGVLLVARGKLRRGI
jgi:hypothetical protein